MSIFDKFKQASKVGQQATQALDMAKNAFSAFDSTQHSYTGMMGNPTTARGREGFINHYETSQEPVHDFEDEPSYFQEPSIERDISEALLSSFRKRAAMKTDMIILNLQKKFQFQKVLAKIIIQNKGDDLLAKKYQDYQEEELDDLPKVVQKVLRNQKHIKAIEAVSIDAYFKESCIDYFTLEFEEDYRNGLTPDFKDINPIELLQLKMQEPFLKLLSDYAVDLALEAKPKIISGFGQLKQQYIDPKVSSTLNKAPTLTQEEAFFVENESQPFQPAGNVLQDINDTWANAELKRREEAAHTSIASLEPALDYSNPTAFSQDHE